jgi:DNA ligase-1
VVDEDGNEDFKEAVSAVKRKSVQMENPKFIIFDILTMDEFLARKSEDNYTYRLHLVEKCLEKTDSPYLDKIGYFQYSKETFDTLMNRASQRGWEGLMLIKDVPYEGKRTKNILKVKLFEREEFVVDSVNTCEMELNDPVTGLKRPEMTFKSINVPVEVDGKKGMATCGTGYTQDQRRHLFKHPEEIIGKTVSIQFQGYSEDGKTGLPSLRIPSLVKIWENGRDV